MVRRIKLVHPVVNGTLIVLCHGEAQAQNIASWKPEWVQGLSVVVVLDNAPSFQASFPMAQIGPADVQGFRAGANRDKGLAWAMEYLPATFYLFMDGDCVPGPGWTESHAMLNFDEALIACGARTENGKADPRTQPLEWDGSLYEPSISPDPSHWMSADEMRDILAHRVLWSCNFGMTNLAAERLLEAGRKVHGVSRIFWPEFDGRWGGEDTGLAILAHLSGVEIMTNGANPVAHIPHGPGAITVKNLKRVAEYADLCRQKLGASMRATQMRSRRLP